MLTVAEDCGEAAYASARDVILAQCAAMKGDSGAPLFEMAADGIRVLGVLSSVAGTQAGLRSIIVPSSHFAESVPFDAGTAIK